MTVMIVDPLSLFFAVYLIIPTFIFMSISIRVPVPEH
jgi:hypothetical protein